MKAKKVLTTALAAAMVFSALPGTSVMAEEIDSSTVYIDTEIIDVTLPTTASQKFYIDPQGLIAVGKSEGGTGAAANGGLVTGAADMYAVNRSSIPLALSVSYKLKDSVTENGVTIVETVAATDDDQDGVPDAAAAIKAATGKQIAVSVSAAGSDQDATSDAGAYTGKVFKGDASGVKMTGEDAATPITTTADVVYANATGATADYIMTGATYKAQRKSGKTDADAYDSSAYEYVIDASKKDASCVKLSIGGYCSEKADWSDYASGKETLKLDVVFKFKKVTTDTDGKTTVSGPEVVLGPQMSVSTTGKITITGLTAEKNYKALRIRNSNGGPYHVNDAACEWNEANYSSTTGGALECQLGEEWLSTLRGVATAEAILTLSDDSEIKVSINIPAPEVEEP